MEAGKETRPPRGALIVIAVGLIACVAAALLRTDGSSGAAAPLAWGEPKAIPDSAAVAVPGGGTMRIDRRRPAGYRCQRQRLPALPDRRGARPSRRDRARESSLPGSRTRPNPRRPDPQRARRAAAAEQRALPPAGPARVAGRIQRSGNGSRDRQPRRRLPPFHHRAGRQGRVGAVREVSAGLGLGHARRIARASRKRSPSPRSGGAPASRPHTSPARRRRAAGRQPREPPHPLRGRPAAPAPR